MKAVSRRGPSRRALLRGAGVALSLPWLESLLPRELRAQEPALPTRLLYWLIPNGVIGEDWVPAQVGKLDPAALPRSLKPLADAGVTDLCNVLSGIDNLPASPDGVGDHAPGLAGFLTCASANRDDQNVFLGVSADQIAAKAIGDQTLKASLELGMTGPPGFCDDYPCPYGGSISWSDERTPRGCRTDPHDVWQFLTGGFDSGEVLTKEELERRLRAEKSVLDYVLADANSLKTKLAKGDQLKLDQYMSGVRTLEQDLARVPPTSCERPPEPPAGGGYEERFALMLDLQLFALECDLTRVMSFMFATSFGPGGMPWAGVADDFHNLTHHEAEGDNKEKILKCIDWEMQQVAGFVARLRDTPEGDRRLIDGVTLCLSSDVGRGSVHNHDDLPVLLAGSGGGAFETGRHVHYEPDEPSARNLARTHDPAKRAQAIAMPNKNKLANLHVSLLGTLGVSGAVGDSNGPLPLL